MLFRAPKTTPKTLPQNRVRHGPHNRPQPIAPACPRMRLIASQKKQNHAHTPATNAPWDRQPARQGPPAWREHSMFCSKATSCRPSSFRSFRSFRSLPSLHAQAPPSQPRQPRAKSRKHPKKHATDGKSTVSWREKGGNYPGNSREDSGKQAGTWRETAGKNAGKRQLPGPIQSIQSSQSIPPPPRLPNRK